MSASVLYDTPGPRARARSRVYMAIASVLLLAALAWVGWKFYDTGQFRGEMWARFQYTDVQWRIVDGLLTTLKVFAIAGVLSLLLGAVLAVGRLSDHRPVRWAATVVVEFFRAMPLLIMIYALYRWKFTDNPMWALVIGLTLYNGSVQAEVIRAGILAVPKGQAEAAYALGMRKTQVMTTILVPQAVRVMLPTIISQLVVTLKDTSLGYVITYEELLYVGNLIAGTTNTSLGYPYIQVMIVIAPLYIAMCLLLSWLARWIEKRGRRSRKGLVAAMGGIDPEVAMDNPIGEDALGGAAGGRARQPGPRPARPALLSEADAGTPPRPEDFDPEGVGPGAGKPEGGSGTGAPEAGPAAGAPEQGAESDPPRSAADPGDDGTGSGRPDDGPEHRSGDGADPATGGGSEHGPEH